MIWAVLLGLLRRAMIFHSGESLLVRGSALVRWAVGALALASLASALADPAGQYRVEGRNPGGSGAYRGLARVERNEDVYRVAWILAARATSAPANDPVPGRQLQRRQHCTGLCDLHPRGAGWDGNWSFQSQIHSGTETWAPDN